MTVESIAAFALIAFRQPRAPALSLVEPGKTIDVRYVVAEDARRKRWFRGTVMACGPRISDEKGARRRVRIRYEDGEVVETFWLWEDLFDKRSEAGWRLPAF